MRFYAPPSHISLDTWAHRKLRGITKQYFWKAPLENRISTKDTSARIFFGLYFQYHDPREVPNLFASFWRVRLILFLLTIMLTTTWDVKFQYVQFSGEFDLFFIHYHAHYNVTWIVPIFFCKFLASSTYFGFIFTFMQPERFQFRLQVCGELEICMSTFHNGYRWNVALVGVVALGNSHSMYCTMDLLTSIYCTDGSRCPRLIDLNILYTTPFHIQLLDFCSWRIRSIFFCKSPWRNRQTLDLWLLHVIHRWGSCESQVISIYYQKRLVIFEVAARISKNSGFILSGD